MSRHPLWGQPRPAISSPVPKQASPFPSFEVVEPSRSVSPIYSNTSVHERKTLSSSDSTVMVGIDRAVQNHWDGRIEIEITEFNNRRTNRSDKKWLTASTMVDWLTRMRMTAHFDNSMEIFSMCMKRAAKLLTDQEFCQITESGIDLMKKYTSFHTRKKLEQVAEIAYRTHVKKPSIPGKRAIATPKVLDNCLSGKDLEGSGFTSEEVITYCKYRYSEFTCTFYNSEAKLKVQLVLFSYYLPENKSIDSWRFRKGILRLNPHGGTETIKSCRWFTK